MSAPSQVLKSATAEAHTRLESVVDARRLLAGPISLADYARLLIGNYRWHALLEPAILPWMASLPELDYAGQRRKLPALEADLRALNLVPAAQLQQLPARVAAASLAEALGLLYVLEGSTLGGSVIRRSLEKQPELADALHYYGLYGESLGARWKQFQQLLDRHLQAPGDLRLACDAAQCAFELAERIFAAVGRRSGRPEDAQERAML